MTESEDQLSAILNNPQIMGQIMSLAQSIGKPDSGEKSAEEEPKKSSPDPPPLLGGEPNAALLKAMAAFSGGGGIDRNQRSLLKALSAYVSKSRINKLERAMRAANIARQASSLFAAEGNRKAGDGHV